MQLARGAGRIVTSARNRRSRPARLMVMALPQRESDSARGRITISPAAMAQIVAETAGRCYGVVGTTHGARVARLLSRGRGPRISVTLLDEGVRVELNVVVEHGLNLAEVAATVRSQVRYELERLSGLPVAAVDVRIQDVRRSA